MLFPTVTFERLAKVRDLTSWKESRPKTTTAPTTAAVR